MELAEIKEALQGDRFDFMVDLEEKAPGYFFSQSSQVARPLLSHENPSQFIDDAIGLGIYDLMLFSFFGPRDTAQNNLLPNDQINEGERRSKIIFKLAGLDYWPDLVELASTNRLEDLILAPEVEIVHDTIFRCSVLKDILGMLKKGAADSDDIQLQGFNGEP
jgi:hypothetical protein